MIIEHFLRDFAECFEDLKLSDFTFWSEFKELDEWDSLGVLSIMGMCKEKYGVTVQPPEIRDAETVEDLYNMVAEKRAAAGLTD